MECGSACPKKLRLNQTCHCVYRGHGKFIVFVVGQGWCIYWPDFFCEAFRFKIQHEPPGLERVKTQSHGRPKTSFAQISFAGAFVAHFFLVPPSRQLHREFLACPSSTKYTFSTDGWKFMPNGICWRWRFSFRLQCFLACCACGCGRLVAMGILLAAEEGRGWWGIRVDNTARKR